MSNSCAIVVTVESMYSAEHSDVDQQRFVFVYDVHIANQGEQAAQLLSRHWLITDAHGMVEEVMGEGVIGEQPVIGPGQVHQYSSFCVLQTRIGYMQGSYQMVAADGERFDAAIPAFTLAVPGALH